MFKGQIFSSKVRLFIKLKLDEASKHVCQYSGVDPEYYPVIALCLKGEKSQFVFKWTLNQLPIGLQSEMRFVRQLINALTWN